MNNKQTTAREWVMVVTNILYNLKLIKYLANADPITLNMLQTISYWNNLSHANFIRSKSKYFNSSI